MKRPEQHETDSAADAIFRAAFSKWAITPSERDYGWDYMVEFFKDHESTGVIFAAQLKGSRHTKYSTDGSFISQTLEKDAAEYLARQLRQPTFLFHADVGANKLFWSAIQLDDKVIKALESGETDSLTVRIPTVNCLPDNIEKFVEQLTRAEAIRVSRILLNTTPFEFAEAMKAQPVERQTEVAEDFHEKAFLVEMNVAFRQHQENNVEAAMSTLQKVIGAAASVGYIEVQFNAVLQLGEIELLGIRRSEKPQSLAPAKQLETANELCRIARRYPKHLHIAAQIFRRAAELTVAVHDASASLTIWQAHDRRGEDPLWTAVLWFKVQQRLAAVHRCFNRALRLARATAKSPYRWVSSRPVAEIALSIGTLGKVLKAGGFEKESLVYDQSAFDLIRFSAAIAFENQSIDELYNAVLQATILEREKDGRVFSWIRSIINEWPEDTEYRKNAEFLLQRAKERMDGAEFEGDLLASPRRTIYNFLSSAGIDPMVEPWAALVDLAVKDDDPTRVLIECSHKNVMHHPLSDPNLVRLGLERANPKIVVCTLHHYGVGGAALDDINIEFKKEFCDSCPDRSPRPDGWNFFDDLTKKMEANGHEALSPHYSSQRLKVGIDIRLPQKPPLVTRRVFVGV